MKTIYKTILKYLGVVMVGIVLTTSCEKYLDKAPQVDISEKDIFSKFISFQGFVEDLYQNVVDVTLCTDATMNYNWGDDVCQSATYFVGPNFELGNYWFWSTTSRSPFNGSISGGATQTAKGTKGYWANGWYGIRNANIALANVNMMVAGTQQERDFVAGQSYFFRGYLHFEILRSWGGIPYIDTVFSPADQLKRPRLTYRETAAKISADLQKAAELLPANWDTAKAGQTTLSNNNGRINKAAAYGYLGKNLLYSASPLMNGEATGNYVYDEALCKQAAVAFYEVIKLVGPANNLGLETWPNYKNNFYSLTYQTMHGKEIVFSHPSYGYKRWDYGEQQLNNPMGGWGTYAGPTQNYVEYFGMANGLPIEAAGSGYNVNNPWVNRDPRFYYSVIVDGDRLIKNTVNLDTWAEYFIGGRHRQSVNSITGFGHRKYQDLGCNPFDNTWGNGYFWTCPQMRLADVYLMYAEAANEAYGPSTVPAETPGGITAVQAVNIVRNRAEVSPGVPLANVDLQFLTSKEVFREQIRRERCMELAFENHRWYDLRRWYIAQDLKYREKYQLEFDKPHSYFKRTLITTTVFDAKHWWLPFPVAQVSLYPGFKQNPGW